MPNVWEVTKPDTKQQRQTLPPSKLPFPPTNYRIKTAGRLATLFLDTFGFDATVSPWRTIYIRERFKNDQALLNHEMAHIAQIDRDGSLKFWTLCIWYYLRYGHKNSPIEIEARRYEAQ